MEVERIGETSEDGNRRNTMEQPPFQNPLTTEERRKKRLGVMVAIDDSDVSLYALKWILENLFKKPAAAESPIPATGEEIPVVEPDPEQGMVTVVHVMQPFERYTFPAEPSMYASSTMVESVRKAQRENAAGLVSRAFQICKDSKIKVETLILEGDPKEMICEAIEQMHFDLLVVGSRGLGAIKREREMETANPREEMLVEKTAEKKTGMKIWIAVDESEGSFYALQWALQHLFLHHTAPTPTAEKDPPFTVTVVHVQPPFQPSYTALPVGPILFATPGMKESVLKAVEESGAKIVGRAAELCDQHKIKAEYLVLKGKPKEILVEAVEQMDVDLLVVGSRGLGHIKRAVLGSISDYCAHHAKCPVLIVRPEKDSQN